MPPVIWPTGDTIALHLPIGSAAQIPVRAADRRSGTSLVASGDEVTAIVYAKLGGTQAASGDVSVIDPETGDLTVDFTAAGTEDLSGRKHYFWVLYNVTTDELLMDGVVRAFAPGDWPSTPYRGPGVRSTLSSLLT